jgi:hypothetical protein
MATYDPGQCVAVGDGDRRVAELGRARSQFFRVRCAA